MSQIEPPRRSVVMQQGGYAETRDGATWETQTEGLKQHYLRSVAVDPGNPDTVLVSACRGPEQAHRPPTAESFIYRRTANTPWQMVSEGPPTPFFYCSLPQHVRIMWGKGGILMKIGIVGAGPAGLYFGLLMKRQRTDCQIQSLGVVRGEQIIDVAALAGFAHTTTLLDLIDQGQEGLARLRQALEAASDATPQQQGAVHTLPEAHLFAPILRPRKNIFCLGRNYSSGLKANAEGKLFSGGKTWASSAPSRC
jgi:hypothetical protein